MHGVDCIHGDLKAVRCSPCASWASPDPLLVQHSCERRSLCCLNKLSIGILPPRLRSGHRCLRFRVRPFVGSVACARTTLSKGIWFGRCTSHQGNRYLRLRNGHVRSGSPLRPSPPHVRLRNSFSITGVFWIVPIRRPSERSFDTSYSIG